MTYALLVHSDGQPTTSAVDTTGADLLVLVVITDSAASSTPSDSIGGQSNTWTGLTAQTPGGGSTYTRLWYVQNPAHVGSGHTFTVGVADAYVAIAAFSGSIASPFDVENGAATASGTSIASGNLTPGQNNELVISGLGTGATSVPTIDSGFTITDARAGVAAVSYGGGLAYLIQTTAGTVNPTWSWTGANTGVNRVASFMTSAVVALDEDGEWIIPTQSW